MEKRHINQKFSFAFNFILVCLILGVEYVFCNYIIFNLSSIISGSVPVSMIGLLKTISVQLLNFLVNNMLNGHYEKKFPDEFYALPFRISFTVLILLI